jgi:hypothetical protein
MKTNLTPLEQFRVLWEFVLKQSPEVEAHGSDELLPDQLAALVELASGKANHKARLELIPLLRSNRKALYFLGEQIKLRRPGSERARPSA